MAVPNHPGCGSAWPQGTLGRPARPPRRLHADWGYNHDGYWRLPVMVAPSTRQSGRAAQPRRHEGHDAAHHPVSVERRSGLASDRPVHADVARARQLRIGFGHPLTKDLQAGRDQVEAGEEHLDLAAGSRGERAPA